MTTQQKPVPYYERWLPEVIATFVLPPVENQHIAPRVVGNREVYLPYPCVRVIEAFHVVHDDSTGEDLDVRGTEECIFIEPTGKDIGACSFIRYPGIGSKYFPDDKDDDPNILICLLYRLLDYLEDNSTRFVEEKVSRQVRRAEQRTGISATHRRFIIVRKGDRKGYASDDLLTRAAMGRRLHVVRSHLRHLPSGVVTIVKAHLRGSVGSAVQVPDYLVKGKSHELTSRSH